MMKKLGLAFLLFFALIDTAMAQTAYVSDVLYITLRTGKDDSFRIIKSLKSGTKMEIIEKDGTYAMVRLEDGTEGWVQERFIIDEPTNELKLASVERKLERVQTESSQLKEKYDKTRSELKDTEKERKTLASKATKLEKQNTEFQDVAARPIQLDRENKELRTKNAELTKEMAELKAENDELRGAENRDWFLTGAGVVLLGVLIGLVVPRLKLRRQSSWA